MTQHSRRDFLKQLSAMSSMGAAGSLGVSLGALTDAAAQTAPADYRALVCIFMFGGNDAFNTVLATDAPYWQHYLNHRNPKTRNPSDTASISIALMPPGTAAMPTATKGSPDELGGVLDIPHSGKATAAVPTRLALHPSLVKAQGLYNSKRLGVLANIGPLVRPLDKNQYNSIAFDKPAKLFSHNDQQSMWQSFAPEGASSGWGGRMGDLLMSRNGQGLSAADSMLVQRSFTCITPASASVWLNGQSEGARLGTLQLQTSTTGLTGLGNGSKIYNNANLFNAVASVMNPTAPASLLARAQQEMVDRALRSNVLLGSKLPPFAQAPWGTAGASAPNNDALLKYTSPIDGAPRFNNLALQLQMVARLIDANRAGGLNLKRQFFMVSFGGFDNHDNQNPEHADRMAQLDHAMSYFDEVLGNMPGGVDRRSQVTTFTGSDFGRTFTNNGDGTDHGWGGHHFVMGGAVKGGDVYGQFPQYSTATDKGVFDSPDQLSNGSLLPTTSVDQMAFTLGRWMGVSDSDLKLILPSIGQFNSPVQDLGFMT